MLKEINQLSIDVKVLMIPFPRLFLSCFVLRAHNISGEELHNKMAAIVWSSLQMEMLKLGRLSAS